MSSEGTRAGVEVLELVMMKVPRVEGLSAEESTIPLDSSLIEVGSRENPWRREN